MRTQLLALILLGLLHSLAFCQDVSLEIKGGGVKIVKVDKVITVQEDLTVVSSFPFTIQAPGGGGLYFWSFPLGVQAVDKGDTLSITAAPQGLNTFTVKAISARLDKDGKFLGFDTKFGSVTFSVGAPGPAPIDPTPPKPPVPDSPLVSSLKTAWADETPTSKTVLANLRDVYSKMAGEVTTMQVPLVKDVATKLLTNQKAAVGDSLPLVRTAIRNELNTRLPRSVTAPLDSANREKCRVVFQEIADGLGVLR